MGWSTAEQERLARTTVRLLPFAVLAYLLAFAWRFADERLYSDSGYYLARIINEGSFRIEHGRWVLAFSQVLPLAGVKLGLGMPPLIALHSLNNVVWLAACVLVAWRVLRDPGAALALVALHLIGLTHGLFCPIFELYYGADLLVLLIAVLRAEHLKPTTRRTAAAILLFIVASSHLFGAVLAVGTLVLLRIWENRKTAVLLLAVLATQSALHAATLTDYEKDHLSFLSKLTDAHAVLDALHPKMLGAGVAYIVRHYPDVLLLSAFTAFGLVRGHARWRALLFVGLLVGMAFVILLKLPGFVHDRYREQVNFVVVAWTVIALCGWVMAHPRWRIVAVGLVTLAAGYRMVQAERIAAYYAERTALIESEVGQARALGRSKGIVPAPVWFGPEHHAIDRSWSTSVESLLLSAKDGPAATVSLITQQDLDFQEVRDGLDGFVFRRWDLLDPDWLDARWFRAPTGRYEPLSTR